MVHLFVDSFPKKIRFFLIKEFIIFSMKKNFDSLILH